MFCFRQTKNDPLSRNIIVFTLQDPTTCFRELREEPLLIRNGQTSFFLLLLSLSISFSLSLQVERDESIRMRRRRRGRRRRRRRKRFSRSKNILLARGQSGTIRWSSSLAHAPITVPQERSFD